LGLTMATGVLPQRAGGGGLVAVGRQGLVVELLRVLLVLELLRRRVRLIGELVGRAGWHDLDRGAARSVHRGLAVGRGDLCPEAELAQGVAGEQPLDRVTAGE